MMLLERAGARAAVTIVGHANWSLSATASRSCASVATARPAAGWTCFAAPMRRVGMWSRTNGVYRLQRSLLHTSSAPQNSTVYPSTSTAQSHESSHDQNSSSGSTSSDSYTTRRRRRRIGLITSSGGLVTLLLATSYRHAVSDEDSSLISLSLSDDPLSLLDPAQLHASTSHLRQASLGHLLRQYVVYLASEQSKLVEAGPWILKQLEALRDNVPLIGPVVWSVFAFTMKNTFYTVFVGGATVTDCGPLIKEYLDLGIGISLNYSAEASIDGSAKVTGVNDEHILEAVHALKAAAQFRLDSPSAASDADATSRSAGAPAAHIQPTMLAIKLTGLIFDPSLLARATTALVSSTSTSAMMSPSAVIPEQGVSPFPASPALSEEDHRQLGKLYEGLRRISATAREQGVRLLIDAEQSWFQAAIDHLVTLLVLEFNTVSPSSTGPTIPIVYNTYQCYRRATDDRLRADIEFARAHNLSFGAKLVRGAYVESERIRHANLLRQEEAKGNCCIWSSKAETDACYDRCAAIMIDRIAEDLTMMRPGTGGVALFAATHNGTSVKKMIASLRDRALITFRTDGSAAIDPKLRGRVTFGQLMGMSDNLTNALSRVLSTSGVEPTEGDGASSTLPMIAKWAPYASFDQALPYLIRRANENQSILQSDPTSGRGGAKEERRAVGKEIRRRLGLSF